jgi:hypothetical protein
MRVHVWKVNFWPSMILLLLFPFVFVACDDDDDDPVDTRTFHVTVQNVSTNSTLQVGAMPDRTAPISPGIWAVVESGTIFNLNDESRLAIERLAEEGSPTLLSQELATDNDIAESGEFSAPGGPDNGPIIAAGENTTFSFDANPGDKLQIMTMFGQSNDWFYAFDNGGLDLFNGDDPVEGDQTGKLILYDAGTELDEMPGLGLTQKADYPNTIDVGPVDPVDMITNAMTRHTSFTIPATSGVIRVTITADE